MLESVLAAMSGTVFHPISVVDPGVRHVLDGVSQQVLARPDAPALRARVGGSWQATSWKQWEQGAREIAAGLAVQGLGPGNHIAVLGPETPASLAADLGISWLGAVTVPLPQGVPPPEIGAILRDAAVACLLVDAGLASRLVGIEHGVRLVIELPTAEGERASRSGTDFGAGRVTLEAVREAGARALAEPGPIRTLIDGARDRLGRDDPWSILYTSGSTGVPRGVVISHGAAVHQGTALARSGRLGAGDEQLLTLPTAQIFGRMVLQAGIAVGMTSALGTSRNLDRDLIEIAPACFATVPEVLERLALRWREILDRATWARPAVEHALEVGRRVSALQQRGESIPMRLAVQHRLAERMVFARMRALMGNRLHYVACGGAALRREIADFFHVFGVPVLEGYGLTEAGGVVSWNRPDRFRFGTTGEMLAGCEVRLADDGELLVRSPSLGRPLHHDADQPSVDAEGFLHTGDLVEIQQGFVRMVGRKRDIIKTAGGKFVAPQKLEQRLRGHEGIARVVVLGEARSRLVALVDIDQDAMMDLARREDLGCRSRTDLVEHPRIRSRIAEAIAAVNATSAKHEVIADFALLAEPLRVAAGELTPAGAPRRQLIALRYAQQIGRL